MLVFEQYGILLSLYLNWLTAAQCCPLLNGIERETDELPRVQYGLQAADSTNSRIRSHVSWYSFKAGFINPVSTGIKVSAGTISVIPNLFLQLALITTEFTTLLSEVM